MSPRGVLFLLEALVTEAIIILFAAGVAAVFALTTLSFLDDLKTWNPDLAPARPRDPHDDHR